LSKEKATLRVACDYGNRGGYFLFCCFFASRSAFLFARSASFRALRSAFVSFFVVDWVVLAAGFSDHAGIDSPMAKRATQANVISLFICFLLLISKLVRGFR